MQLASKMRFLAAQVDALLADGLWLQLAGHANQMARRLAAGVGKVTGVRLARAPEANAVFAHLSDARILELQARHQFYVWKPGTDGTSEVRWMCSWDTTEQDVDAFVRDIGEVCA
jgi:threonine aldolase